MEKIKQALDRARKEQLKSTSTPPPRSQPTASNSERSVVQDINYNQTRVLEIDRAILRRNKIIIGSGQDPAAETAFKILRTQVEQRLAARNWNSIAVTSPGAGAGKTTTAINLSMALAQEMHRTVLLVDLDFRNPSVHHRFECSIEFGLVDYLLDDVPVNEILINPGVERLVILPAGRAAIPNSSELVASPKMIDLVEELKTRYPSRIIVFDLPPLLWSDDTLAFSPYVDTTLLVISEGITTKEEVRRVMEVMGESNVMGTVLNNATEIQPTYYYK
ncbi:MAG: protein-tyrosine kinase [Gammaproteobacteria bacterium]